MDEVSLKHSQSNQEKNELFEKLSSLDFLKDTEL